MFLVWTTLLVIDSIVSMDEPLSIDELIAIMKEREAAIQAVSVRMTVQFGIRPPLNDGSRGPMSYTSDLYEVFEEAAGRCRVSKVTQVVDQRDAAAGAMMDVVKIHVYNGEVTRILTSSLEKPLIGEVNSGRSIDGPFWGSTFPVITKFSTTLLSEFLETYRSHITQYRIARIDTKEVLDLEMKAPDVDRNDVLMVGRLRLDLQAGYAPVKVEIQDQRGSSQPYLRFSYEMAGHVEVIPGLWLPQTAKFRGWGIVDGASKRDIERTADVVFEEWVVNPASDAKTFALSFPKGLQVYDGVQNTTYFAKEVDDRLVEQQVAEARRLMQLYLAEPPPVVPTKSSLISILIWIAVGVLVTIGIGVILERVGYLSKHSCSK